MTFEEWWETIRNDPYSVWPLQDFHGGKVVAQKAWTAAQEDIKLYTCGCIK